MKKIGVFFCTALVVTMAFVTTFAGPVCALPSLQLGPGSTGTWSYNNNTQTWIVDEGSFDLNAYANSYGGNGDYAWETSNASRDAYLVISAVPKVDDDTDVFNVTVSNDGSPLSISTSGYGTPSVSDPNDLAPHSIYKTYFEIYQFQFDQGDSDTIYNTKPLWAGGDDGSGPGYTETFGINIISLAEEVLGVHFDLFTMDLNGEFIRFAPYSHDAETAPVPEPASLMLLGSGLLVFAGIGRKKLFKKNLP
jgi:hypothetical protein